MKRDFVLTVRPRTPADDEAIVALARPSFSRYSQAPGQSVAAMMRARTAETLVAEEDRKLLGFAIVTFEALPQAFGPWLRPVVASLDAIAVNEKVQGGGVGTALLSEVERVSRARGAVTLTLRTAVSNLRAQALFRRAGFRATVQIQSFYRGGLSAFAMSKLLAV